MAGIPRPVVDPRFGPVWTPMLQNDQTAKQQNAALNSGAPQGNLLDQWGNTIQVQGSNLAQTVTIGASHGVSGVLVSTGIASGTSGLAVQSGPAITTITLTAGSTAATVGTVTGASLAVGQVIGAADVSDPSSGTPTPAIKPGTTILAISGSSVTLSQNAVESGTALYCAAARFILQQDSGWVALGLTSGWTPAAGYYLPSVRAISDRGYFSGGIASGGAVPPSQFTTLSTVFRPAAAIAMVIADVTGSVFNTLTVATGGAVSLSSPPSSDAFCLDGISYRLT